MFSLQEMQSKLHSNFDTSGVQPPPPPPPAAHHKDYQQAILLSTFQPHFNISA